MSNGNQIGEWWRLARHTPCFLLSVEFRFHHSGIVPTYSSVFCWQVPISYSNPGRVKSQTWLSQIVAPSSGFTADPQPLRRSLCCRHIQRLLTFLWARCRQRIWIFVSLRFSSDYLSARSSLISKATAPPARHYSYPARKQYWFATSRGMW